MNQAYITSTGAFLPNESVDNENISQYIGKVLGENRVREKILKANGIESRHYALDKNQDETHTLYEIAS